jgi:uncharacterized protein YkwD
MSWNRSSRVAVVLGMLSAGQVWALEAKDLAALQKAALARHNTLRAKHGAKALVADEALRKQAQKWAERLASANSGLKHSNVEGMGENLYYFSSTAPTPIAAAELGTQSVDAWYGEIKDYTFGEDIPSNFGKVGHFTQVVWKGTRKLGCGAAASADGQAYFVVCNYSPQGNVLGEYAQNVVPVKKK